VKAFLAVAAFAYGTEINDNPAPDPSSSRKNVTDIATTAPANTARHENSGDSNTSLSPATTKGLIGMDLVLEMERCV
jgi:hypothetical protein